MKNKLLLTLALTTTLLPLALRAEEGGSGHYIPGATASFIDTLPGTPGAIGVVNIFTFYNGSAGGSRPLEFGGLLTLNAEATIYADTVGAIYETPLHLLGGDYAIGLAVPYVWLEVEGSVQRAGPFGGVQTVSVRDTASGFGDMTLYPFMLGWKRGDLKYDVRLGIYAPTGPYDVGHLANTGRNYWTFEPSASVSWLSTKIGTEVTLFAAFDFSTENEDTHYQSGDVFHLDATVAQHLPLGKLGFIGVGANAFYYQQISGDSGSGATLGSLEGRTVGIGPVVSFATKVGKSDVVAEVKWLPELNVQKRLNGDIVWFKLAVLF